jgi:inositol 1,4,5-triphosphate receptor type 1
MVSGHDSVLNPCVEIITCDCSTINSEDSAILDLDGTGGKTFLRVLLHLGMHDYPPLVSGALKLLFRHFAQRQEVLQAFKQV